MAVAAPGAAHQQFEALGAQNIQILKSAGWTIDRKDLGGALCYAGTELKEVVTSREGAAAYRVGPEGESRVEPRLLI